MHQGVTSFYRRFDFFDSETLADSHAERKTRRPHESKSDEHTDDSSGLDLFDDFEPNCASSGHGVLCFGDNSGKIAIINRDLQIFKFQSHSHRIQKLFKTKNSDLLITLGKHQDIPQVRVFSPFPLSFFCSLHISFVFLPLGHGRGVCQHMGPKRHG